MHININKRRKSIKKELNLNYGMDCNLYHSKDLKYLMELNNDQINSILKKS